MAVAVDLQDPEFLAFSTPVDDYLAGRFWYQAIYSDGVTL